MTWTVELAAEAERQLERLPESVLDRVEQAFAVLSADPSKGKALLGDWAGHRSYRIGQYRVVYTTDAGAGQVIVRAVAKRGRVYQSRR